MTTDTFLTQLLQVVLSAVATILTAVIVPWVIAKIKSLQSQVGAETFFAIQQTASIAVAAAEQSGLAGLITNIGAEKKAYAISAMQKLLEAQGIRVDVGRIESAIEAAVLDQIRQSALGEIRATAQAASPLALGG